MDKNFVNIDNLVRQRLAGGEEQERSGSWQNMRELLDKEMPQERPVGLFYWRRMLSAIAVLVLIGTVGVGGYKISSSVNGGNARNTDVGIASVSTNSTPGAIPVAASNSEINKQISTSDIRNENQPPAADNDKNTNKQPLIADKENQVTNNHSNPGNNENPVNNKETGNNHKDVKNTVAANNTHINKNPEKAVNDKPATANKVTVNNENTYGHTDKKELSNIKQVSNTALPVGSTVNNNKPSSTAAVAVTNTNEPVHSGNKTKTASEKNQAVKPGNRTTATVADVTVKNNNAGKVVTNNVKERNTKPAALNNPAGTNRNNKVAVNNDVAAVNKDNAQVTSPDKMTLGSHAPSVNNTTSVNGDKAIDTKNEPAKDNKVANTKDAPGANKNSKPENTTATSIPVFVTKSGKKISGDKLQRLNIDRTKRNETGNTAASVNALKSKRVIQRMALVEHFIKTTPGEGFYKLDTISIVTLTEELGIITETKTIVPANTRTTGDANSSTKNKATADPQIIPAAAPAKSRHTHVKENASSKKTSGSMSIENLSAAFNDIKYNVAGVQFAPGLTAGINGTFFGPNSFKGFQFGFTGNFIFNEKLAVMSELKYFHRINNNYYLNDNYYAYTALNGGGYSKELQLNAYSFSTLHSFELPIAIRFTEGKFNFFAGGNILYTFAINTGAASQPDPNNTTTASSIGSDNAPKLKEQDFNSRFGFGYLFGASYQVSPNVTIDFRNVQTIWDNSKSQGAKMISNQLYKSPSLQLSFGYRLGGNKK